MSDQIVETTETTNDDEFQLDELTLLKKRADALGITYHPNIGLEKLKAKINEKQLDEQQKQEAVVAQVTQANKDAPKKKSAMDIARDRHARERKEANKLVRVRITCMNPNKKDWQGEMISAGNSVVGQVKKYIPFNAQNGWYVPQIILNVLQERQCQIFETVPGPRGGKVRKGKLIKEFAIEVLPGLNDKELKDLANQQAMSKSLED